MTRSIPDNAKIYPETAHLYCDTCREPQHPRLINDILLRSIEDLQGILDDSKGTKGMGMWYGARGVPEDEQGTGGVYRNLANDLDPVYEKAFGEIRENLKDYPLQGGHNYTGENGNQLFETIYSQKTNQIPSYQRIEAFIKNNNIKGIAETNRASGGMSEPSKMWGGSEDLPTAGCQVGGIMRKVKNSTCSGCLVDFGQGKMDAAERQKYANMVGLANPRLYAAALSWQIANHTYGDKIRLNSSGDIQNAHHIALLADVARSHPQKKFWLATREREALLEYLEANGGVDNHDNIPSNMTVRLSAQMQGSHPDTASKVKMKKLYGEYETFVSDNLAKHPQIMSSSVNAGHLDPENVYLCPSAGHKGSEGTCEHWNCDACWDPNIHVDYTGHSSKAVINHVDRDKEPDKAAALDQAKINSDLYRQNKSPRDDSQFIPDDFDINQFM